jgi:quercetin dioxygenase-like cupin family protein
MKDTVVNKGDIILLEPGEATSFEALQDTTTFVIKFPSVKDDKYLVEDSA